MSRITTLSSNALLIQQIFRNQERVRNTQLQTSSSQISPNYKGLGANSRRLISFENQSSLLKRFEKNNHLEEVRQNISRIAVEAVATVVKNFTADLNRYSAGQKKARIAVQDIQNKAFASMAAVRDALNAAQTDGRYLFAGGQIATKPLNFNQSSLAAFKEIYDGDRVSVSTTRDAHLESFSFNKNVSTNATSWLNFEREDAASGVGRINAAVDTFKNVAVGTSITISGTTSNNGTYKVLAVDTTNGLFIDVETEEIETPSSAQAGRISFQDPDPLRVTTIISNNDTFTSNGTNDTFTYNNNAIDQLTAGKAFTISGTTSNDGTYTVDSINTNTNVITIKTHRLTDEGSGGSPVAGTISASSYYKGDALSQTHRIDTNRSFKNNINGAYGGFEKAIRAMEIIAQGDFGSAGGLDQNTNRPAEAIYLLDSALNRAKKSSPPPYGTELTENIRQAELDIGVNRLRISDAQKYNTDTKKFLDNATQSLEDVNMTETVARLLSEQRALEVSFQAFATIRQLSLSNFM